jgi:hypothetical protein
MSNVSIKMCPPCLRTPVHHVSGTYTPGGRGDRPRCLTLDIDLKDLHRLWMALTLTLSQRERGPIRGCLRDAPTWICSVESIIDSVVQCSGQLIPDTSIGGFDAIARS